MAEQPKKKQPREARTEWLRVRVSPAEKREIERKAAPVGGISALLRDHLGRVSIRDRDTERQRVAMLNRINANLNMIARWANVHKSAADAAQVSAHLVAVEAAIRELIEQQEAAP